MGKIIKDCNKKVVSFVVGVVLLLNLFFVEDAKVNAANSISNPQKVDGVTVCDSIYLGKYYQDDSSKKDKIKWIVLSVEKDSLFVLADRGIECLPFNNDFKGVMYDSSSLRNYLNSNFYNDAFTDSEKSAILTTNLENSVDKVFLLSEEEATNAKYGFESNGDNKDDFRLCYASNHAKNKGCEVGKQNKFEGACNWWLRTSGDPLIYAKYVDIYGYVNTKGSAIDNKKICVRPAMRISLNSTAWEYAGKVDALGKTVGLPKASPEPSPNMPKVIPTLKKKQQNITYSKVKKYKSKKLKKSKVTFKLNAKTTGDSKLKYSVAKTSKKLKKYISVSKKGKVTLKKGAKKGKYKVNITAPETNKYKKATLIVIVKVV